MTARRDVGVYLEDILESIKRIEKYTKDLDKNGLAKNIDKQDAIVYRLEIIGEAVKHIPQEIQTKYSTVPWKEIAKTRDKIIHHYFEIDINQIWSIIKHDLTPLKKTSKDNSARGRWQRLISSSLNLQKKLLCESIFVSFSSCAKMKLSCVLHQPLFATGLLSTPSTLFLL